MLVDFSPSHSTSHAIQMPIGEVRGTTLAENFLPNSKKILENPQIAKTAFILNVYSNGV